MITALVTITSAEKAARALEHGLFKGSQERRTLLDMLIGQRSGQLFRIAGVLTAVDARRVLKGYAGLRSYEIRFLLAVFPDTKEFHTVRGLLLTQLLRRSSDQLMDVRSTLNDPHDEEVNQWWPIYALKSEFEREGFIDVLIARKQKDYLQELLSRERKIFDELEGDWSTAPFLSGGDRQLVEDELRKL